MGKLTVKAVAALKEPGRYADGDGLHLRIDSQGRKYWVVRVQRDGRRRDVNLGPERRLTLAEAREAAEDLVRSLAGGSHAARPHVAQAPTFAEAARLVHGAGTRAWRSSKHGAQWLRTLEQHVFPVIGGRRLDQVGRKDVHDALSPIWIETPETARRVLQRIDRVLRWGVAQGHRDEPVDMAMVRAGLPRNRRRVQHMRAIAWEDVPAFYAAIESSRSTPLVRAALRWMILTVPRPGNVGRAKVGQVDRDARIWTIPAGEMKGEDPQEHRIPLAPQAISVFEMAASIGSRRWLFSAGREPMSPDTMRMAMRRMGLEATPHGFRSSFKEWSLAAGWPDHLSERQLAHADRDKVRAAYARSDLLEERRPMMEAWARFVTGSGSDGKGVQEGAQAVDEDQRP